MSSEKRKRVTMEKLKVREGTTGILYLMDERGRQGKCIPDYGLDKAHEPLFWSFKR